jgi:hypothetical protein
MVQPEWVGDGTAVFDPGQAVGVGFSFDDRNASGTLWVDDISFLSAVATAGEPPTVAESVEPEVAETVEQVEEAPAEGGEAVEPVEESPPEAEEAEEDGGRPGFCPGSTTIGLAALLGVYWTRRRPKAKKS